MPFLFEPDNDPDFAHNLAGEKPRRTVQLKADVSQWQEGLVQIGESLRATLSAEDESALDALGYMGEED